MAKKVSIEINAGQQKKLLTALTDIEAHSSFAAAVWAELTPSQRESVLAHSPILARLIAVAAPFQERG